MKEVFLIAVLIVLFVSGYFLMKKIDFIMDGNLKNIENESEKSEPSYIVLTKELSDEEITEEIKQFRNKHGKSDILICVNRLANQSGDDSGIKK